MHYIVMDLEWNNTFGRKTRSFINEIIEIGAVMLDDDFNVIDEFSQIIKSQIGKKLRSSVKNLTHITNDDIKTGVYFIDAVHSFQKWIGKEENVIMTWGDGDIRVLLENFRYLYGNKSIPFLSSYADAQKYFESVNDLSKSQQISLVNAADLVGINTGDFSAHRALDDSRLTGECIKKCFDKEKFMQSVKVCDNSFYQKLEYKPRPISKLSNPLVDKSYLSYVCEKCGSDGVQVTEWKYSNQYFRAIYHCPVCSENVRVAVRYKKYFDKVEIRKTVTPVTDNNKTEECQQ